MTNLVIVDDNNFDSEVIKSNKPVLLEFGASWCGPCKRQLPILEKIASQYTDQLKVVKVDIDEAPNFANKFGIKSVPSLFIFNLGEVVGTKSSLSTESEIKSNLLSKVNL